MAIERTRKSKENPHYRFLYSWKNTPAGAGQKTQYQPRVKRRAQIEPESNLAQISVKKDILHSLILVSLILTIELVIYLGLVLS